MHAFVGIDVAKSSFVACMLVEQQRFERSFSNDDRGLKALNRWICKAHQGDIFVTMEATGRYFERIADFALEQQWSCFVLNPLRFKYYAQSQSIRGHKTDLVDARLMALYLRAHHTQLHPWSPPKKTKRLLRDLTRRLASIETLKRMQLNMAEGLAQEHPVYLSVQRMVASIEEERQQLQHQLNELFTQDEQLADELKRLKQIPGCGAKLATVVLSELGDVHRFKSAKEVTAWAGLVPKQHESGSSIRKRATTHRGGSRLLKRTLYMASVSAIRSKGWQKWVERQRAKGKKGKRLVVAMMDKLLRVIWGVLRTETCFDSNHLLTHGSK